MILDRTEQTVATVLITARYATIPGIDLNEQFANFVSATRAEHQETQHPNPNVLHAANAAPRPTKRFERRVPPPRVVKTSTNCRGTLEPKATTKTVTLECKDAANAAPRPTKSLCVACPEHKCSNCEGTLEPNLGPQPKRLPSNARTQRLCQHDPQNRKSNRNCERTLEPFEGPQPKRLPWNANYDVRRMPLFRPQRKCPSKSQFF